VHVKNDHEETGKPLFALVATKRQLSLWIQDEATSHDGQLQTLSDEVSGRHIFQLALFSLLQI
jgi:hypothetical protein